MAEQIVNIESSYVTNRVHAFGDDVLADHDAVALAEMIRHGEVERLELAEAAIARAEQVNQRLNAIELPQFDEARERWQPREASSRRQASSRTIPTSRLADAARLAGRAAKPAAKDGSIAKLYLAQGFTLLGKTRLPEFGFNCSTEFEDSAPTRNPWHTDYSCGGSSGGSAALVAAGVVPIAHANDGGGSIRIPAACCGLIGLKVTRQRFVTHDMAKSLPVNVVCDGVVTRSVRDTAHFVAGAERYWRNQQLPEIGLVEGPGQKRLKIGLVMDSLTGSPCPETRAAIDEAVTLLESLGHRVEEMNKPIKPSFVDDFVDYWGFLAFMTGMVGKREFGSGFDVDQLDGFTRGLARRFRRRGWRIPLVLYRLKSTWRQFERGIGDYDAVITPVLGHVTPKLGYVSPDVPFEVLLERLMRYASYTPLNNANGSPAISLPMGLSAEGLPIGVHLSAPHGAERTLLELAYEIEQARPWHRITDDSVATVAAG